MNRRKPILIAVIGLAGVAIFGVTALATAGVGFHPGAQVRGTLSQAVHLNHYAFPPMKFLWTTESWWRIEH